MLLLIYYMLFLFFHVLSFYAYFIIFSVPFLIFLLCPFPSIGKYRPSRVKRMAARPRFRSTHRRCRSSPDSPKSPAIAAVAKVTDKAIRASRDTKKRRHLISSGQFCSRRRRRMKQDKRHRIIGDREGFKLDPEFKGGVIGIDTNSTVIEIDELKGGRFSVVQWKELFTEVFLRDLSLLRHHQQGIGVLHPSPPVVMQRMCVMTQRLKAVL